MTPSDPDLGETFSFALIDDAGGRFAIDLNSGQIAVANAALIGSDNLDSYALLVEVEDSSDIRYQESFTINIDNFVPVAIDDTFGVTPGGTLIVGVDEGLLFNDFDFDPTDTLTASRVSGPSNGTVTVNPDGTFEYTHDGGNSTSDSFEYQVCLLYTSPSPRDRTRSRMPSSA